MRYEDEENAVNDLRMIVEDVCKTNFVDKEHVETVVRLAQEGNQSAHASIIMKSCLYKPCKEHDSVIPDLH